MRDLRMASSPRRRRAKRMKGNGRVEFYPPQTPDPPLDLALLRRVERRRLDEPLPDDGTDLMDILTGKDRP